MATLANYRNLLGINKLRLDDELEVQAQYQEQISTETTRANTRMLEKKDELQRVEARLVEDFREGATKDLAEAKAKRHPDRRKAWDEYQRAREEHELWDGMLNAWKTKGFKLADLGALFGSDYFAIRTITRPEGERRRELNSVDEESRQVLRQANESASAARPVSGRNKL